MRTLITGINGFVGTYLGPLLASKRWEVFGTIIDELHLDVLRRRIPSGHLRRADLRKRRGVEEALRAVQPDVIYHLAGQAHVPASWRSPRDTFEVNLMGTIHLLDAARRRCPEAIVILITSGDIYDLSGGGGGEQMPDETWPLAAPNPYALSKLAVDLLGQQYAAAHGMRTIRLRPFNHIGPRQSERFVVADFARQIARIEARRQAPVIRVGNLEMKRDFTDVRDMVRAYWLASRHCAAGDSYNISSQRATSIRSLLDRLCALSPARVSVEVDPAKCRPADTPVVRGNSRKFRQATGWRPQIRLERTLRDTLHYWRRKERVP